MLARIALVFGLCLLLIHNLHRAALASGWLVLATSAVTLPLPERPESSTVRPMVPGAV